VSEEWLDPVPIAINGLKFKKKFQKHLDLVKFQRLSVPMDSPWKLKVLFCTILKSVHFLE
jgi:hypothetical protein